MLRVFVPDRAGDVVLESSAQLVDCPDFHSVNLRKHKSLLVSLVAVPFHGNPANLAAVRAPHRSRVIAPAHRNAYAFSALYIIYVYLRVCRERIFQPFFLAARVGNPCSVRAPAEFFKSAERLGRQLVRGYSSVRRAFAPENVNEIPQSLVPVESPDKTVRDFRHPMIPMAVHQSLGFIGFGLWKIRINLPGSLHTSRHGREEYHLRLVGREFEFSDSGGYVADFLSFSECPVLPDLGDVNLPSHKVGYFLAIRAPACVADALPRVSCKMGVTSVYIADVEIPAGAILRD